MNVNTTRRSVLQMSAALAAMTGASALHERVRAASEFAADAEREIASFPQDYRANPTLFAEEAEQAVYSMERLVDARKGFGENLAAAESAEFERAKAFFQKAHPEAAPLSGISEWSDVDESAFAFAFACFDAGIRKGAAYEHLRLAQLGSAQRCMQCNGVGYTHTSMVTPGADLIPCDHCAGSGVVDALDTTYHYAFMEGFRS